MVNHCFNLCICRNFRFVYIRLLEKKNKQKRQFYVTALFPTLRYNKVVCILQLNPSRHFNVCFKHCQKETFDLPMKTKLYRRYFVEQLAKSSVYVCVFCIVLTF